MLMSSPTLPSLTGLPEAAHRKFEMLVVEGVETCCWVHLIMIVGMQVGSENEDGGNPNEMNLLVTTSNGKENVDDSLFGKPLLILARLQLVYHKT